VNVHTKCTCTHALVRAYVRARTHAHAHTCTHTHTQIMHMRTHRQRKRMAREECASLCLFPEVTGKHLQRWVGVCARNVLSTHAHGAYVHAQTCPGLCAQVLQNWGSKCPSVSGCISVAQPWELDHSCAASLSTLPVRACWHQRRPPLAFNPWH